MTDLDSAIERLRASEVAAAIRRERLIVVLRRVAPTERLVELVLSLADDGARIFEVTFDAPTAATDLVACREALARAHGDACHGGRGHDPDRRGARRGVRRRRAVRRQPAPRPDDRRGGPPPRRAGHPGRLHADRDRRRVAGRRHVREAVPGVVGWTGPRPRAPRPDAGGRADPDRRHRRVQRAGVPRRRRRRGGNRWRDRQRLARGPGR